MLQYSKAELLHHSPLDFDITDYDNPPYNEIGRKLQAEGHATFETGHKIKDGRVIPVEVHLHVITLLGKRVGLAIVRDITERKNSEEALRQIEEKFRGLPSGSSDLNIITDMTGTATYVSLRDKDTGLCTDREHREKTCGFYPSGGSPAVNEGIRKNLDCIPTRISRSVYGKKTEDMQLLMLPVPRCQENRIIGVQVIGRDITSASMRKSCSGFCRGTRTESPCPDRTAECISRRKSPSPPRDPSSCQEQPPDHYQPCQPPDAQVEDPS
jgi:hypothetical protein